MKSHRRLLIIGIVLIFLLFSLTLNYLLFKQGEQYYLQLNASRLDPIGLSYFDNAPAVQPGLPVAVFYGDSRAANWPAPSNTNYQFVNRGIGSQTSIQVLGRFDHHIKPIKPEVVIIQVGINDLKTIPLFPQDRKTIVANCEKNIQSMVQNSVDLGATVILTTIFPVGQVSIERRLFWSDEVPLSIIEVNTFIHSLASSHVLIFDAYTLLVGENGIVKSEYSYDLLHLADAGYRRLNNELVMLISEKLDPANGW